MKVDTNIFIISFNVQCFIVLLSKYSQTNSSEKSNSKRLLVLIKNNKIVKRVRSII